MTPSTDTPIREGSRDGQGGCLVCGKDTPSTRAKYCGRAHQQHSYRLRHHIPTPDLTLVRKALQRRKALVDHTAGGNADIQIGFGVSGLCALWSSAFAHMSIAPTRATLLPPDRRF